MNIIHLKCLKHSPQVFLQRFPCQFRLLTSHLRNTQKDIVFLPCKENLALGEQYTQFYVVWDMCVLWYVWFGADNFEQPGYLAIQFCITCLMKAIPSSRVAVKSPTASGPYSVLCNAQCAYPDVYCICRYQEISTSPHLPVVYAWKEN